MASLDERDERIFQILNLSRDEFQRRVNSVEELSLQRFTEMAPQMAANHMDLVSYRLDDESRVSCVNWRGRRFITGTDIVRILYHRYKLYMGHQPLSPKKFEEGVFSDLRRLSPPHDCHLEPTRSDFLVFLFNYDCVRSKKKQKVFFWTSYARCANALFCDAIERELARMEMARAVNMNIEDFIKSGIVPTGGVTSMQVDSRTMGYDWTIAALHPDYPNQPGHRLPSIEHVHVIRNDMAAFLNRHLRGSIQKRKGLVTPEAEQGIQADLAHRTGTSAAAMSPSMSILGLGSTFASGAAQDSELAVVNEELVNPDESVSNSPYGRRRRQPTAKAAASMQRTKRKSGKGSAQAASDAVDRPVPALDPMYAPDDSYSVSTLSSDEEAGDEAANYNRYLPAHFHQAPPSNGRPRLYDDAAGQYGGYPTPYMGYGLGGTYSYPTATMPYGVDPYAAFRQYPYEMSPSMGGNAAVPNMMSFLRTDSMSPHATSVTPPTPARFVPETTKVSQSKPKRRWSFTAPSDLPSPDDFGDEWNRHRKPRLEVQAEGASDELEGSPSGKSGEAPDEVAAEILLGISTHQ